MSVAAAQNFDCPETGVACSDARCLRGRCVTHIERAVVDPKAAAKIARQAQREFLEAAMRAPGQRTPGRS